MTFLAFGRPEYLLLADALSREAVYLRGNGLALPGALEDLRRHCQQQAQGDSGRLEATSDATLAELLESAPVALRDFDEVATALRLSRKTVEREVAAGRLQAVSIGRRRLVRQCDLDNYVAALTPDTGTGDPEAAA